ncbi:hypothetical protein [Nonomuraea sp. NPDC049400]
MRAPDGLAAPDLEELHLELVLILALHEEAEKRAPAPRDAPGELEQGDG